MSLEFHLAKTGLEMSVARRHASVEETNTVAASAEWGPLCGTPPATSQVRQLWVSSLERAWSVIMERTVGLNHLVGTGPAEPRERLGGKEHKNTEQIASAFHPHPLGFYHFSTIQPNFKLPAPVSPFPRASSGGSAQE